MTDPRPLGAGALVRPPRTDARVARIVRAWRSLTTPVASRRAGRGERTIVACSGGADSSALAIALAAASDDLVIAHVVHDLRARPEALADRDAAAMLAERLGLVFVGAEVAVAGGGGAVPGVGDTNAESRARRARYGALRRLATENGCRFIATAHHADDQIETMLMAMLRGAGPRGMSGIAVSRSDGPRSARIEIIRPLLGDGSTIPACTRADTEAICRAAGWVWREDATNADTRLLRNAIRREVLPILERLRPGSSMRAARGAVLLRGAAELVRSRAIALWSIGERVGSGGGGREANARVWTRASLRSVPEIVLGEMIRFAPGVLASLVPSERSEGLDRLSRRTVAPAARAIRDACTDPRVFTTAGVRIVVTARTVRLEAATA